MPTSLPPFSTSTYGNQVESTAQALEWIDANDSPARRLVTMHKVDRRRDM